MVQSQNTPPSFTVENNVYKGQDVPYSGTYKSIGEMMWKSINNHGNTIAQLDARTEEAITFFELQNKIVKCALWLKEQGIKHGDVISVCTHNHLNSVVPCLAATYINAIFNPWDEDMNLQTALHVLQLTSPKIIFCNEKSANVVLNAAKQKKRNCTIVVFGNLPQLIPFDNILNNYNDSEVANFRYDELNNIKDTLCILHSSGTTGMPKGVELSNYCMLMVSEEKNIDMKNMIPLWFSSLYWISGVMMSLRAIYQGAKVIIYPEFDEEMTCKLIDKYKISWLFLGTSMTNRFIKAGYASNYSLSSLKFILCGGAILKATSQDELRHTLPDVTVLQAYGMTEIGGIGTLQQPHHKCGSCGTVTKNIEIKVVDPDSGKVLGPNESGELWIKAGTVMNGYYKNPVETKKAIDEEGWIHTGDLVYIDEDGELFVIERIKELIKYRGHQISPGEVESILLTHPDILEAGVVAVPHDTDDEHPIAYVTKKPGSEVTERELIDLVANNMMDHFKLRAGVIFLDDFPYTGSGKIARKELKAMAKQLAAKYTYL